MSSLLNCISFCHIEIATMQQGGHNPPHCVLYRSVHFGLLCLLAHPLSLVFPVLGVFDLWCSHCYIGSKSGVLWLLDNMAVTM